MKAFTCEVRVHRPDGSVFRAQAHALSRSKRQAFFFGARRSLKIIGFVLLGLIPFAMVEPFLFLIWGSAVLFLLFFFVGPLLHWIYAGETHSLLGVQAPCPTCKEQVRLKPYISSHFEAPVTVICPACGATTVVERV